MLMTNTALRMLRIADELNAPGTCLSDKDAKNLWARMAAGWRQLTNMKTVLKHIIIGTCLGSLSATAAQAERRSGDPDDVDYHGSDCIWIRSIRDYSPLDDETLLIWAGSNRPYLVRLTQRSMDMRSTFGMSVISRDEQLCPYGGDGLKFGALESFPASVRAIDRITPDQADQLLVRYGKKAGSEPPSAAPREVEGAEVEELD